MNFAPLPLQRHKLGPLGLAAALLVSTARAQDTAASTVTSGMVSFIFDDGYVEDYTTMYPMFKKRGFPAGVAMITRYLTQPDPSRLTAAQLKELQSGGWEILSHTETHPDLTTLSPQQMEQELSVSRAKLRAAGFTVNNLAYPLGSVNSMTEALASRLYRGAFWSDPSPNVGTVDRYHIHRVPMGSYLRPGEGTVNDYKNWVVRARQEKLWVVFLLHSGSQVQSAQQVKNIEETLDYIAQSGLPVVTPDEGLNRIHVPKEPQIRALSSAATSEAAQLVPDWLTATRVREVLPETYTAASPATAYPRGVTYMLLGDKGDFPLRTGLLKVERLEEDPGFTVQTLTGYRDPREYRRTWLGEGWSAWKER